MPQRWQLKRLLLKQSKSHQVMLLSSENDSDEDRILTNMMQRNLIEVKT